MTATTKIQRNHGSKPANFNTQTGERIQDKAIYLWTIRVLRAGVWCDGQMVHTLAHASEVAATYAVEGFEYDIVARTEHLEASFGFLTVE